MKVFGVVVVVVINAKRFIEYCAREEERELLEGVSRSPSPSTTRRPIIAPDKRPRRNISKVLKLKSDGLRARALFSRYCSSIGSYTTSPATPLPTSTTRIPHRHFPGSLQTRSSDG